MHGRQKRVEQTGRDLQTLKNLAWVASRFATSRRRDALSWSHHAEVAAMEPADADRLLELAERDGLSQKGLREAVQRQRHELVAGEPRKVLDVPELNRKIANQIHRVRSLAGESQRDMAESVFGSVSQQGTISRLERGQRRPNVATLQRLAQTYNVPMASFGVDDSPLLPAALVQQVAQEAIAALDGGEVGKARKALERLSTALVESDLG